MEGDLETMQNTRNINNDPQKSIDTFQNSKTSIGLDADQYTSRLSTLNSVPVLKVTFNKELH